MIQFSFWNQPQGSRRRSKASCWVFWLVRGRGPPAANGESAGRPDTEGTSVPVQPQAFPPRRVLPGGRAGPDLGRVPGLPARFLSLLTEQSAPRSAHIPGSLDWEAAPPGPVSTNTDRPPQSGSRRGAGTAALGDGERGSLAARAADVGLPRATAPRAGGGGLESRLPPGPRVPVPRQRPLRVQSRGPSSPAGVRSSCQGTRWNVAGLSVIPMAGAQEQPPGRWEKLPFCSNMKNSLKTAHPRVLFGRGGGLRK